MLSAIIYLCSNQDDWEKKNKFITISRQKRRYLKVYFNLFLFNISKRKLALYVMYKDEHLDEWNCRRIQFAGKNSVYCINNIQTVEKIEYLRLWFGSLLFENWLIVKEENGDFSIYSRVKLRGTHTSPNCKPISDFSS